VPRDFMHRAEKGTWPSEHLSGEWREKGLGGGFFSRGREAKRKEEGDALATSAFRGPKNRSRQP